ncbi:hypothetical protein [Selenomonas sp. F0473]|uniref:hypothetical protein n=1 Tax=Selenomonas sp. F0473 TaxID=999423 RepID=UPI00029E74B0|nr:hypothetical protein [Selenomonas sp. F0473]EKU72292.1 hypothetical protein HMPREF9161_00023 [Selenomonas sp. F0473]
MSESVNFSVGEPFPLPILAQADGGMFQADKNGIMFLLQLSRTDAIAVEAFRTGEIELAVTEVDGILFFLYRIDGIFKDGWGDAPFSLSLVKDDLLPNENDLADPTVHLYFVDTRLKILLAQRTAKIPEAFADAIRKNVRSQLSRPCPARAFQKKVSIIWAKYSAADLRARAIATHTLPFAIKTHPIQ